MQVTFNDDARIAQLTEHVIGNDEVTGLIPVPGSIENKSFFSVILRSEAT
jgi:hypothetical protein